MMAQTPKSAYGFHNSQTVKFFSISTIHIRHSLNDGSKRDFTRPEKYNILLFLRQQEKSSIQDITVTFAFQYTVQKRISISCLFTRRLFSSTHFITSLFDSVTQLWKKVKRCHFHVTPATTQMESNAKKLRHCLFHTTIHRPTLSYFLVPYS